MAMGKKKRRQDALWIVASDLPKSAGHPFYQRLNVLLEANGFDRFTERVGERLARRIYGSSKSSLRARHQWSASSLTDW